MEVRCKSCNKLFRVSDDKITGSGVKFTCTRCSLQVTITREEFEQYKQQKPAPTSAVQPARVASASSPIEQKTSPVPPPFPLGGAATAATAPSKPVLQQTATAEPKKQTAGPPSAPPDILSRPEPVPKAEPASAPRPKPEPAVKAPAFPTLSHAAPAVAGHETSRSGSSLVEPVSLQTPVRSGAGKKAILFILVLLVIGGGAYGAHYYLQKRAQRAPSAVNAVTPDGLQIVSASGTIDTTTNDLVIAGTVENSTDTPKPGWYIVVEVYDAQTTPLARARMLNGKQVYTKRDYEILAGRGVNVQELKVKSLQEQGTIVPAKGSVNFEIRLMDPPATIASFNATLQPFDPVQLFKEIAEEQK